MNFSESTSSAWESILVNKLRSILTALGIIIGVAAVIGMLSVGESGKNTITNQISSMGTNLIMLNSNSSSFRFSLQAAEFMKENSPHVASAVPSVTSRQSIRYAGTAESKTVEGVTQDYLSVRNRTILEGDFFTPEHLQYYRKVAVIGNQIAKDFFGDSYAVGEKIRIGGQSFEVIGTLVEKGSSMGQNMDEVILLPLTTLQRLIGRTTISNIYFAATDSNSTKLAMAEIESSLRALYGSRADRTNVYFISSMDDLLATINTATQTLTIMLAGIAGISLLVGGIGIMNIMLVSVTERTREIGVRKAMGAKRRDILIQFLIEAVILSLFGGVVGLFLGIGIALAISTFAGWAPYISISAIVMALTFSISIGIFFGLYPANRASNWIPLKPCVTNKILDFLDIWLYTKTTILISKKQ